MPPFLNIRSEIGPLEAVLLHRPGRELERLTPQTLKGLLFDDIPWLERMRQEHDQFAAVLQQSGAQVFYTEELLADILEDLSVRESMADDILNHCGIHRRENRDAVLEFLDEKSNVDVAEIFISGLLKDQVSARLRRKNLSFYIKDELPFFIPPIPNLYFSRDPASVIGHGVSLNSMNTPARKRESMLIDYIVKFHPRFQDGDHPVWYERNNPDSIEGGDILVLRDNVVAVGCSERTTTIAIEELAINLFRGDEKIKQVLAIQIPFKRAFMHLDTVLTMVDVDAFTIYPGIEEQVNVFRLSPTADRQDIHISPVSSLSDALKEALELPAVRLIQSGGSDHITAAREQWSDSTNTLAVAPGVVVTYKRNVVSNEILRDHGITVLEIEGSELVRGRGGPRCMSMPLRRGALT